ncbi:hypothetical protein AVEN_193432-1 [Araneus ventricosus]|uniref:Uncharacterized protein n=1 Tax=Araneus ventricosus TaxID=182803 RepID=A0A4Y2G9U8_ARAVE|nr:hypothetical protein AVEN_193432-1 [Araneus ventricosus]
MAELGAVPSTPPGYVNGVGFMTLDNIALFSLRCLREFVGGPFLWENRAKGRPHTPNLTKYFSKLFSYNNQHRTANFLRSWQNNQRLKKTSPLGHALKMDALHYLVEFNSLKPIVSHLDSLPGVFFHTELLNTLINPPSIGILKTGCSRSDQ